MGEPVWWVGMSIYLNRGEMGLDSKEFNRIITEWIFMTFSDVIVGELLAKIAHCKHVT